MDFYVHPSEYKDHLGNFRLSYSDANSDGSVTASEIIEESNFYPFGLKHKVINEVISSTNIAQKSKYNGKELQDELELNVYDYGWRKCIAIMYYLKSEKCPLYSGIPSRFITNQ